MFDMTGSQKVLITGANGQLGCEFRALQKEAHPLTAGYTFCFADKSVLDITNKAAIAKLCDEKKVDVIINCAAYTAVDKAESEPEVADLVNHKAVRYLAEVAKEKDISLIHISTDYVFDGASHTPYTEDDKPNPINVYGQTKLDGELALKEVNPSNSFIIRTSWVYSSYGNNFVKTMLRFAKGKGEMSVVYDQIGTPTYARDLALVILNIISADKTDLAQVSNQHVCLLHFSNLGVCSWYDFAKAIFDLSEIDCRLSPILSESYPTPALRISYSVMAKAKIESALGMIIPYWRDSLDECLKKMN